MTDKSGFVIADTTRRKFRRWGDHGIMEWTADLDDALQLHRKADAERVCEDDEDAWYIITVSAARQLLLADLQKS